MEAIQHYISHLKLFYSEAFYPVHLRLRFLHDTLYKSDGTYKRISDYRYARAIRRAVIVAFIFSIVVFGIVEDGFLGSLFK